MSNILLLDIVKPQEWKKKRDKERVERKVLLKCLASGSMLDGKESSLRIKKIKYNQCK